MLAKPNPPRGRCTRCVRGQFMLDTSNFRLQSTPPAVMQQSSLLSHNKLHLRQGLVQDEPGRRPPDICYHHGRHLLLGFAIGETVGGGRDRNRERPVDCCVLSTCAVHTKQSAQTEIPPPGVRGINKDDAAHTPPLLLCTKVQHRQAISFLSLCLSISVGPNPAVFLRSLSSVPERIYFLFVGGRWGCTHITCA